MSIKKLWRHVQYASIINPSETNTTVETSNRQNSTKRTYLDANKLANVRRDIVQYKRLTEIELGAVKVRIKQANP